MKKRILPVLLALCMVMSLLPVAFAEHTNDSCTVDGCTTEGCTGECTKASPCQACQDANCAACQEDEEEAPTPGEDEEDEVIYCNCAGTHAEWIDRTDPENPEVKTTCTNVVDEAGKCATCLKTASCNPCGKGGCTLLAGHTGNHKGQNACVNTAGDTGCTFTTHGENCPNKCDLSKNGWTKAGGAPVAAVEGEDGGDEGEDEEPADPPAPTWTEGGAESCNLTKGHSGPHSNTNCIKDAQCGAAEHAPDCPVAKASGQCGAGGCTKAKNHTGNHNNTVCLGYNANGKCDPNLGGEEASDNHISGCDHYDCGCDHTHEAGDKAWDKDFDPSNAECTSKPGCAHCNEWNAFVSALKSAYNKQKADYDAYTALDNKEGVTPVEDPGTAPDVTACTCKDCKPNPAMGAVVDENGNVVDPTDPTEPEVPSKAEDFTDMEDWMAADVQVALDKGWLEGYGDGTFNGRGVTSGATIAAVLARMDGETITGITWAQDALKWAEEQDACEGIELTGDSMARKDLVLVIWRMAGKPAAEKELEFTDVDGLEGDHLTAMQWAVENGIVKGNGDGTVTPDGSVNRAALCAMLARYDALEK